MSQFFILQTKINHLTRERHGHQSAWLTGTDRRVSQFMVEQVGCMVVCAYAIDGTHTGGNVYCFSSAFRCQGRNTSRKCR
jgi:hypothetical protein